jgi:hypothetical protein
MISQAPEWGKAREPPGLALAADLDSALGVGTAAVELGMVQILKQDKVWAQVLEGKPTGLSSTAESPLHFLKSKSRISRFLEVQQLLHF